ncbi:hypothetical protein P152DRAFT_403559, partial [Eremomyces bilateralis CBS 781.70]
MAQQQAPQRPPQLRQPSYLNSNAVAGPSNAENTLNSPEHPSLALSPTLSSRKRTLEDSQEWVLFSPDTATSSPSLIRTHTASTGRTLRTVGLTRYSDVGSLDTAARSDQISSDAYGDEDAIDVDNDLTCHGSDEEGTADLDSLDDGLHAFHELSDWSGGPRARLDQSGGTVLPTHDGFGSFNASGTQAVMQEQIGQFERYNTRRRGSSQVRRRTSSIQRRLDALQEVEELTGEHDRIQMVERWRLEQSKALLEEIERETRRMRRMSRTIGAAMSAASATGVDEPPENESWWQRFTRKVIRDLMGIDENLLSVIFGEALPIEATASGDGNDSAGTTPTNSTMRDILAEGQDELDHSWEHRLLSRIARELGSLVHQLSEHPGAFSTYVRTQETPTYVGARGPSSRQPTTHPTGTIAHDNSPFGPLSPLTPTTSNSTGPLFQPTVQTAHRTPPFSDPSLWGIEEEEEPLPSDPRHFNELDRVYWERELDAKLIFNFLRQRFSSRPSSPTPEASGLSRSPSN